MKETTIGTCRCAVILLVGICFFTTGGRAGASSEAGVPFQIEFQDGVLIFQARQVPLSVVLNAVYEEFQIVVDGLEKRYSETITCRINGANAQGLIKGLLSTIGETNYAFEFSDDRLRFVTILPKSRTDAASPPLPTPRGPDGVSGTDDDPGQTVSAVVIMDIVEESQAMALGLQKGDLILQYDGRPLTRASQLVEETRQRSPHEAAEMVLRRDGDLLKVFVTGGFIGVRIKTVRVTKDWVDY